MKHRARFAPANVKLRAGAPTGGVPLETDPLITEPKRARERFEATHAEIRARIVLLDYRPGTKLSEALLAEEFAMSRTPMRRVLARLEDEGLLSSKHGVGTFVTDVEPEELGQVYRLRKELVLLQTSLDVVPPTPALVAQMQEIVARAKTLRITPCARDFSLLDQEMFLLLLDLTRNEPLRIMSKRLYFRTTRIWLQQVAGSETALLEEIDVFAREAAEILNALEIGDLDAVGHIRRGHISLSFARMSAERGSDPPANGDMR